MSKYTFFWRNKSPFSNWYPSTFVCHGITFTRGEQYMMYCKAMMFGDQEIADKILATDDPKLQKDLGRMVKNYDEFTWARKREDIMVVGLYEKFNQIPKLRQALLDTGTTTIVEASPYDCIWGIGLEESHPDAQDESKWRGQNLLGKVLMRVRDKLKVNRIDLLAVEARLIGSGYNGFDRTKLAPAERRFAELIIRECMECAEWVGKHNTNPIAPANTAHAINRRIIQQFGISNE